MNKKDTAESLGFRRVKVTAFSEAEIKRFREMKKELNEYNDALGRKEDPDKPDYKAEEYDRFTDWAAEEQAKRFRKIIEGK